MAPCMNASGQMISCWYLLVVQALAIHPYTSPFLLSWVCNPSTRKTEHFVGPKKSTQQANSMPYEYQPLPELDESSDDVYIRLLELHQGPRWGPITGRLYSTLLSKAPAFLALSYCWGSIHRNATIHITNAAPPRDIENDNTLRIPTSLIPFLYRTRDRYNVRARTLWIDSICLNQDDPDEKNFHVPKMRDVYMKAMCTISWLGPNADDSAEAMKYAEKLSHAYRKHMAEQKLVTLTPEEEKQDVQVRVKMGDRGLKALLLLLDRPYFERAWIAQEVIVSKQVYFICGERDCVVSWQELLGAYLYLIQVQSWVWEFYSGMRIRHVIELKLSELEWQSASDVDWPRVLLRHRFTLSGDPRDKIFAFFGLKCKQAFEDLGIVPNYEKSTEEVYIQLAARALKKKHFVVLCVPRLILGKEDEENTSFENIVLPSWVPDWRCTESTPISIINAEGIAGQPALDPNYCATRDSELSIGFDSAAWNEVEDVKKAPSTLPKLIRLRGVVVARVTKLTRRPWQMQIPSGRQGSVEHARLLQSTQQHIHEWEAVCKPRQPSQIYTPTGELALTAMYETFMVGSIQYPAAQKETAIAAFERRQRVLRFLYTFHLDGILIFYFIIVIAERLFRRFGYINPETEFRLMVGNMANRKGARMASEGGPDPEYLALVPGICNLGDSVVLVEGVKVPLILKPKGEGTVQIENGEAKTVRTWEFMGDSYVHGIMDGVIWDKRKGECEDFWIA
ncbi:heterokaryon incompatibility protein-domain-containing protein [Pyrenochaeta sp. MPI-SDFR-AT-0127]|nr:heterokaryon incompatibility protein-domain-containing protein [Pyrenochaeta sp. MPI-SDFR-AT-0127]